MWRPDRRPDVVQIIDDWARVLVKLRQPRARVRLPAPVQPIRPEPDPPRKIEKDPREIAAFFRRHVG